MDPEERDRLVRLEERFEGQQKQLDVISGKLDSLLTAAHMGRGAWWLIIRIGAVLAALAGFAAWAWERLPRH